MTQQTIKFEGAFAKDNRDAINANFAELYAAMPSGGGFTSQQYAIANALTPGATVAWNLNTNQAATLTPAQNFILSTPTNMKNGGTYTLAITQDATGGRVITFGANYIFSGGTKPTLSTAANAKDLLTFYSDGTNMYGVAQLAFS